ncbi:hypothetical protein [Erythrobacter aureus]|uniref:Uncharacterized protein n=1 Tax=Erythrobacter aureus TaxID=2182384 RepID=A0A345YJ07_9SPHN|nr:hypothetical protein [Erythrobacter aureus]AXK43909.1 hypothetical protein DVR09_15760 [Erythrobacter aureus]
MSNATARRFQPIFPALIVPETVEALRTAKGADYTRMTGAQVLRKGKAPITRTVMAFGRSHDAVKNLLVPGKPVELAVQHDGGSIKVIGLPRAKAEKSDMPAASLAAVTTADIATLSDEISSVLWLFNIDEVAAESIVAEMISGVSERPAEEEEFLFDNAHAEVLETYGHVMLPLLHAGLDEQDSARITDLILELPAYQVLEDICTLREQQSVHGLLDQAA